MTGTMTGTTTGTTTAGEEAGGLGGEANWRGCQIVPNYLSTAILYSVQF